MEEPYRSFTRAGASKSGGLRLALGVAGGSFALGAALVALLWWQGFGTDDIVRVVEQEPPVETVGAQPETLPAATPSEAVAEETRETAARVEEVAEQQGGIGARVTAMEQRLARLDLQLEAAAGNAARAEGLLITFAARRAIERGTPLGYLGDQLRLRFGDARPNAVQTVLDFSQQPVTLDQLLARLDGLEAQLVDIEPRGDLLSWFGREVSGLFVVRREDQPSPQPRRRFDRARLFLESGRPEAAVAEVRNMPGAEDAERWIADAERYARVQRALELLETTAILESRGLRDGAGNFVEQPSPAGGGAE
jgi:hypothetical protein